MKVLELTAVRQRLVAGDVASAARRGADQARAWGPRVVGAVADQGFFTGANFAVNLLLARWLDLAHYGAFAATYSVFALAVAGYSSIVVEPMLVFGAERYRDRFPCYLGAILSGHFLILVPLSGVMIGTGIALQSSTFRSAWPALDTVGAAIVGASVALPSVLAMWTLRRACYVRHRPALAAIGSAVYLVVALAALYGIVAMDAPSVQAGFLALGAAGVVAGGILVWVLKPTRAGGTPRIDLQELAREHWDHGKWLVSTSVFAWLQSNVYYILLPGAVGLTATAELRAMSNVFTPWYQGVVAVSVLLIPHFTTLANERGAGALRRSTAALSLLYTGAWAALLCVFVFIQQPLVHLLYRGRYDSVSGLLVIMALTPLPLGIGYILSSAARAMRRPDVVFRGYVMSTVATLTLGAGLVLAYGVSGAIVGGIAASSAGAATLAWFVWRERHG